MLVYTYVYLQFYSEQSIGFFYPTYMYVVTYNFIIQTHRRQNLNSIVTLLSQPCLFFSSVLKC
jgi:hypothetical protein